jgi:hypothetical protein
MYRARKLPFFILLSILLNFAVVETDFAKPDKKKPIPSGTPVLWRRPTDINQRDLFLGPGGDSMRPDLRRLTFIKEEKGGYSKKYRVRDASGREWVVKVGNEAQSETSAVRLLWGLGYVTEINYLVPRVSIPGKGTFANARFEARPDNIKRLDEWSWKRNPFLGTPEFQGLKIMMALINNWDLKDSNNQVLVAKGRDGNELRYIISDLGATFGYASTVPFFWRIMRSRNNPSKFAKTKFLEKVKEERVKLHYGGRNREILKDITVNDAEWLASWLTQLSDQQLADAFRAANYTPSQVNVLVSVVRQRADELLNLRPSDRIGRTRD